MTDNPIPYAIALLVLIVFALGARLAWLWRGTSDTKTQSRVDAFTAGQQALQAARRLGTIEREARKDTDATSNAATGPDRAQALADEVNRGKR